VIICIIVSLLGVIGLVFSITPVNSNQSIDELTERNESPIIFAELPLHHIPTSSSDESNPSSPTSPSSQCTDKEQNSNHTDA